MIDQSENDRTKLKQGGEEENEKFILQCSRVLVINKS